MRRALGLEGLALGTELAVTTVTARQDLPGGQGKSGKVKHDVYDYTEQR